MMERDAAVRAEAKNKKVSDDESNTNRDEVEALKKEVNELRNQLKDQVGVVEKLHDWTKKFRQYNEQDVAVLLKEGVLPIGTEEEELKRGAPRNLISINAAVDTSIYPQSKETEVWVGQGEDDEELGGQSFEKKNVEVKVNQDKSEEEKLEEGDIFNLGLRKRGGASEASSRERDLENKVVESEENIQKIRTKDTSLASKIHTKDALLVSILNRMMLLFKRDKQAGPNDANKGLNDNSTGEEQLQLLQNNVKIFSSIVNGHSSDGESAEEESSSLIASISEGNNLAIKDDQKKSQIPPKVGMTLFDVESGITHSFQDSIYLLLMTENVRSWRFVTPLLVAAIAVVPLVLVILNTLQSGKNGNPLDIPTQVSGIVRIAQVFGGFVGILTEQETVQGVVLLTYCVKSPSIQLKVGKEMVPVKRWRILLTSLCFLIIGYLFLANLAFVIGKAEDVLSLFYDIVAIEFVLHIDDLAFWIFKLGIFGAECQLATDNVSQLRLKKNQDKLEHDHAQANLTAPTSPPKWYKLFTKKLLYLVNFAVVFASLGVIWEKQGKGSYGCEEITVNFPEDETWDNAIVKGENKTRMLLFSYFNGLYKRDGKHNGFPRYVELNKENGEPFLETIGAEIIYCTELKAWVFTHPQISQNNVADAEQDLCVNWLMRSSETRSYELIESAEESWDVWVGVIKAGSHLSIRCNVCESEADCNYHGTCNAKEKRCECKKEDGKPTHFGQRCQLEMPCEALVTENLDLGNQTQLLIEPSEMTKEGFITSYNRPIYVMNGLSGIPKALLRVIFENDNGPFEDDDFFRDPRDQFDKDPLKDTLFDFGGVEISLRNYAAILAYSGSRWFGTVDEPNLDIGKFYNAEYHAFWENTYSERTFLVSGPTSNGSPIGVEFFSPRRRKSDNEYGPFGILLPHTNIDGVGFFQCYANDGQCSLMEISVSTENKSLPLNIGEYFNEDQRVSWQLLNTYDLSYVEQESSSVLLGATFNYKYCLPDGAYMFQMIDEVCKSSWWQCNDGVGEVKYNISVNGTQIREAYGQFQESKFTFSIHNDSQSRQELHDGNFCSSAANFNLAIYTDGSPHETSWELRDAGDSLLLAGGPYPFYKTFTAYNSLACLEDGGYNLTLFDSGRDGMNSPGINVMVGDEYLVKERYLFGSSMSISFNLMDGALSSPITTLPFVPPEEHHSIHNCSVVYLDVAGNLVDREIENHTLWSLFDVLKQGYIFQAQPVNHDDPKARCLYKGVYTYTYENSDNECINDDLMFFNGSHYSSLYVGKICQNSTFSFIVKEILNEEIEVDFEIISFVTGWMFDEKWLETKTLGDKCMDEFHLVVPNDDAKGTADTSWELSGRDGIILNGGQFGDSSTLYSHHACLGLGTYKFTTWSNQTSQYSLSYNQSSLSPNIEQVNFAQPRSTRLDSVDVSDLSFNWSDIGDVGTPGNSYKSGTRDWIVEGSGKGIEGYSDSFHYIRTKAAGNVTFTILIESFSGYSNGSSVGGIMFRDTLDVNSRHFSMFKTGQGRLKNSYRRRCKSCQTFSDEDQDIMFSPNSSVWLRVAKVGREFNSFYREVDSREWKPFGPTRFVDFSSDVFYVGVAVTAHDEIATVKLEAMHVGLSLQRNVSEYFFTRWETNKLIPNDGENNTYLGTAIALDGDTMVIGAKYTNNAYVFTRNGDKWREQATFPALDGEEQNFGDAVALDGDILVITQMLSENGLACVYIRNGDTWEKQAKLFTPPDGVENNYFHTAVALEGDTMVIAARASDSNSIRGFASVFIRNRGIWEEQDKLVPSDKEGYNKFGSAVALEGDTVVITDTNSGVAYVFVRNGGTWEEQAKLLPNDRAEGEFGHAIALDGDTMVITARMDNSGSAYVFIHNGDVWQERCKLLPWATGKHNLLRRINGQQFGEAVALNDDILVITALGIYPWDSSTAYVFIYNGDTWSEHVKLLSHKRGVNDNFGKAVALDGNTLVITAPMDDYNVYEKARGSAYIFSTPLSNLVQPDNASSSSVPSLISTPPSTDCIYIDIEINVMSDQIHEESGTLWSISRVNSILDPEPFFLQTAPFENRLYSYVDTMCLERGEYEFTINDQAYGEGIYYNITVDGHVLGEGGIDYGDKWNGGLNIYDDYYYMLKTMGVKTVSFSIPFNASPTFCESGQINVYTDIYPRQIDWMLSRVIAVQGTPDKELVLRSHPEYEFSSHTNVYEESSHTNVVCLEQGEYEFTIYDTYGGNVIYRITVGETVIEGAGNFGSGFPVVTASFSISIDKDQTLIPNTLLPTMNPSTSEATPPTAILSTSSLIADGYDYTYPPTEPTDKPTNAPSKHPTFEPINQSTTAQPTKDSTPQPTQPVTSASTLNPTSGGTVCCAERNSGYQMCQSNAWCNMNAVNCGYCGGAILSVPLIRTGCCSWGGRDCSTADPMTNAGCHYMQSDCEGSCGGNWQSL